MPKSIRSITSEEAKKFAEFIEEKFSKKENNYYAVIVDVRGSALAECLPQNRTWHHINAKHLHNFAIDAIYKQFDSKKSKIVKNNLFFFVPITEKKSIIGGVGFFTKDHKLNEDALIATSKYVKLIS